MLVHSKKPNKKMAGGGSVKGVHEAYRAYSNKGGESQAGFLNREFPHERDRIKSNHHEAVKELKSMPNPKLKGLAHGGEVDMDVDPDKAKDFIKGFTGVFAEGGEVPEQPEEMNMSDMAADELMEAIHSKDKSKMVSAMKAMISACMNDEGSDD
jgi:hypothetical protein